jgi:hypothetical protein
MIVIGGGFIAIRMSVTADDRAAETTDLSKPGLVVYPPHGPLGAQPKSAPSAATNAGSGSAPAHEAPGSDLDDR